jgi:ubiquinone/menaquinone biosynthesis C-methylase UbiE
MEVPYSGNLRIWEGWTAPSPRGLPSSFHASFLAGPHSPAAFAERLFAFEALSPRTRASGKDDKAEPYSLQWYLNIENQRHRRQGRWIPRLLEFSKHAGETLLGLGDGMGTDWLQYARHGASVIVCTPSAEQLSLIRRNFELRGLSGRFLHASPWALPLEAASIDVVCMSSLAPQGGEPGPVLDEVYRVLKPGGKVLAVAPALYDVAFWSRLCFPLQHWLRSRAKRTEEEAARYSRRGLRRLFGKFVEHRIHRRQLHRSQVPHLWRWAPMPLLERLMGRVLVLKAFKPVSAAISVQAAA